MTSKLEIRHKQRQDEIINAARRCFRRCGFHAASMSQIASEAQLSVGQIYRYFANKDAIIEEMVRRIIDFRIAQMDIDARTDHFPEVLALRKSLNEDDDALMRKWLQKPHATRGLWQCLKKLTPECSLTVVHI